MAACAASKIAFKFTKEAAGIDCCFGFEDTDEDPTCRSVDCHEKVAAGAIIGHLRQLFHVDMQLAGFIGLDGAVLRLWCFGLQIAQVSYAMPTQAAVQPSAEGVRVQKLAHHRQQVI